MKKERPRGRPPEGERAMQQIAIRLPQEMLNQIESIVADRYGQADRTAVIRELLAAQLSLRAKRK